MKVTRVLVLPFIFLITPFFLQPSGAYARTLKGDPVVIQVIQLNYADAQELASLLAPLISPHGRIVAYARTNSLIIMDRASIVRKLVEIIKDPIDQHP
jgi:type II secretory pathway component GspD/PulD (secretin)